jgi:ABC-type uncharacterized transport system ATPase subunit
VRRAFSDGAVVVRGEQVPVEPGRFRSVAAANSVDGTVRYVLREDATPRDLFRELAAADVSVERFEVEAPSLAEIFIRAVEGDERANMVA